VQAPRITQEKPHARDSDSFDLRGWRPKFHGTAINGCNASNSTLQSERWIEQRIETCSSPRGQPSCCSTDSASSSWPWADKLEQGFHHAPSEEFFFQLEGDMSENGAGRRGTDGPIGRRRGLSLPAEGNAPFSRSAGGQVGIVVERAPAQERTGRFLVGMAKLRKIALPVERRRRA